MNIWQAAGLRLQICLCQTWLNYSCHWCLSRKCLCCSQSLVRARATVLINVDEYGWFSNHFSYYLAAYRAVVLLACEPILTSQIPGNHRWQISVYVYTVYIHIYFSTLFKNKSWHHMWNLCRQVAVWTSMCRFVDSLLNQGYLIGI